MNSYYSSLSVTTLKRLRDAYGVSCPHCKIKRPRANASILLPGQMCKVDEYVDPRSIAITGQELDTEQEIPKTVNHNKRRNWHQHGKWVRDDFVGIECKSELHAERLMKILDLVYQEGQQSVIAKLADLTGVKNPYDTRVDFLHDNT